MLQAHHIGILKRALREGGSYSPESRGQARSLGTLRAKGYFAKVKGTTYWALTRDGVSMASALLRADRA